ncbi:molecular chaperone regulator BAG-1, Ubiquitin-related domain protein [Artemisia annua]|uniref:Molecular chaperone regulator BAG-1, Ubiquitin-related domain protein n=1 Tax=Artemisia annua TaxID=35608 RepID=A0A2U1NL42_ARTAN|nr:molecular chaperone regulator BAG-1, Ubiquitin-related domain protein [Artemisia annua]
MLGVKSRNVGTLGVAKGGYSTTGGNATCEVRPCGMLVQKRNSDVNQSQNIVHNIKVRVKYGSVYHEVNIKPHATFGELKKMLVGPTGLNLLDQKIVYKDKERDSKAYLDVSGVKDGSRMVLFDDIMSREKRLVENLKTAKTEKAKTEIVSITSEIDKLAKQVGNLEIEIYGGKKVVEKVLLNLIELLMSQLIKLDGIIAEGDVKLQRRMQVKRVQKYIEVLDMLKIRNSKIASNSNETKGRYPLQQHPKKVSFEQRLIAPMEKQRDSMNWPIVATKNWEKF